MPYLSKTNIFPSHNQLDDNVKNTRKNLSLCIWQLHNSAISYCSLNKHQETLKLCQKEINLELPISVSLLIQANTPRRVSTYRCTTNLKLTIFDVKIIATINSIISRLHKVINMKCYNRNLVACLEIEYEYSS